MAWEDAAAFDGADVFRIVAFVSKKKKTKQKKIKVTFFI